ncbi:MAG: MATE family efflux transporter [Candidatus Izemoplasmatales bacterium]|jgi:putative MATE family efflux protein|nr:MATE family efflux transporter [Candidatus Izemoplasmatales bacterium]
MILFDNPIWKGIVILSFPVFLVNILKTLHDVVDGIFLGTVPDVDGVSISTSMQSAIGLTWPVYFIFISFGMGLSIAGNALIGQYIGKNDMSSAKRYSSTLLILTFCIGLLFTLIVFLFTPEILKLMGAKNLELGYAITYLRIRSFELPFLFLSFGFQAVRQSTGDTITPVVISAISIVSNIILTAVFVLVLHLGIAGAAYATLIANIIMLPFIVLYLSKPRTGIHVHFDKTSFDLTVIKDILRIALPASVGQAIQAVGFVILNASVYSFGEDVSAAFYIGNRINSLVMFPILSVSAIVAIYVAQNIGNGNIERAKKTFRVGMRMAVILMTVGAALIIPFRFVLVSLFNHDPATLSYAADYTLFLHIGLPFMAVFQTYLSTFQGSGDTKYTLIMAVTRLWFIRIPLVFLSMRFTNLGPAGIWYSILISNFIMIFVGAYLYSKIKFLPKIRENNFKSKHDLV